MRPLTGLLLRVGNRTCAIPIEHVVETMRPLAIERVAGTLPFVLGLAIVRGEPLTVLDAAKLLGADGEEPTRFVTVRAGDRMVALAVGGVEGVVTLDGEALEDLPPLASSEIASAIAPLDDRLLMLLRASRIVAHAAAPTVPA